MKKCIYILALFIFFWGIGGCTAAPTAGMKSMPGASGVGESHSESTPAPAAIEPADTPDPMPGLHTYEIQARLHDDMPEYRFAATGTVQGSDEWAYGFVLGLNVYDESGKSLLAADFSEILDGQVVGYHVYNEMMDTMGLHVVDVNFDEYKDVIILNTFGGAHSNTWYNCWLWDKQTSLFVPSKSFAEICNPAIDAEKKCIYSAGGSGAAYWGGMIYKFIDGEYVVTNELETGWDGLAEKALVNGEMEIVRQVSYRDNDELLEREKQYYRDSGLWQLDHPHWYWQGGHHADQWLE
ncbi:MAG: hypothetical protein AAGU12_06265 [Clostridiales bacterium]